MYVLLFQHDLMHCSSSGQQVAQQAANDRHHAEVFELKHQLSRLSSLFEKGNRALQQRAQARTTVHAADFIYDTQHYSKGVRKERRLMGIISSS